MALKGVDKTIYRMVNKLKEKVLALIANIEVNIDYPEYEDAVIVTNDLIIKTINEVKDEINRLLKNSKKGLLIKNGLKIVIVGKPNVGKSSILNALLDENKAIMELIRVLNRNGKLIITVPICLNNEHTFEDNSIVEPKLRMKYFCQEDHVRLYGKDFKQRIEKYNVLVQEFKLNDQEKKLLKRNCVLEDGIIFIITKK